MKACISIELETLWSTRAELRVEAELSSPRFMCEEAHGENERELFGQKAPNDRHQEDGARELRLDRRDVRLEERDRRVTEREETAASYEAAASLRERVADYREREDMEREVRRQREE